MVNNAENMNNMVEENEELPNGTEIFHGQYTIKGFVNSGGWGKAYTAINSLGQKVLLKECFPEVCCIRRGRDVVVRSDKSHEIFETAVKNFVAEARNVAKLNHPTVVKVHQVFEDNNTAYMAMEFIEGSDLHDLIDDGFKFEPEDFRVVLSKLLGALHYIHSRDVLHRDISPDNIIMSSKTDPVLIDFGAARNIPSQGGSRKLTKMHIVKDGYSPQEFYLQGSEHSAASDLYSLAATCYHVLTGEAPASSQARIASLASSADDPVKPLADMDLPYDDDILKSIDKAMAILPADRTSTAEEWMDDIGGSGNVLRFATSRQLDQSEMGDHRDALPVSGKGNLGIIAGAAAVASIVGLSFLYFGADSDAPTTSAAALSAGGAEAGRVFGPTATDIQVMLLEQQKAELAAQEAELDKRKAAQEAALAEQLKAQQKAASAREAALAEKLAAQEAAAKSQYAVLAEQRKAKEAAEAALNAALAEQEAAREAEIAEREAAAAAKEAELARKLAETEAELEQQKAAQEAAAAALEQSLSKQLAAKEAALAEEIAAIEAAAAEREAELAKQEAAAAELAEQLARKEAAAAAQQAAAAEEKAALEAALAEEKAAKQAAEEERQAALAAEREKKEAVLLAERRKLAQERREASLAKEASEKQSEVQIAALPQSGEANNATVKAGGDTKVLPLGDQIATSAWKLEMPFRATMALGSNGGAHLVVRRVDGGVLPSWFVNGLEIHNVNDKAVATSSAFVKALSSDDGEELTALLTIKQPNKQRLENRAVKLRKTGQIVLANGIEFTVKFDGNGWFAVVQNAPDDGSTTLLPGDRIVLDSAASIEKSIKKAVTQQQPLVDFSVNRGDRVEKATITLKTASS